MDSNNNGHAAKSYSAGASSQSAGFGSYSGGRGMGMGVGGNGVAPSTSTGSNSDAGLRRRNTHLNGNGGAYNNHHYNGDYYNGDLNSDSKGKKWSTVENLDFMFPKVAEEFTATKTHGGGVATLAAYGLILILVATEIFTWMGQNRLETSTAVVDTSLGKQMRVNMNITFPALACEDLHLDAIDVAGDSQINIEDTLKKKRLHLDGSVLSAKEIDVDLNMHSEVQARKLAIIRKDLPDGYCGPCYGAHEKEDQCCDTCDDVIEAYKKKKWKTDLLQFTAEQCVREGKDKKEPKKISKDEGCNLSGYMTVNRVAGNFHIALGEGVERDGRHIHIFNPEDAINFNSSHIIHHLAFGPEDGNEPLNGVTKIVTETTGKTGLFQYFIKIVPTTYVGEGINFPKFDQNLPSLFEEAEEFAMAAAALAPKNGIKRKIMETNRFFFTERYTPLMVELLDEDDYEDDDTGKAATDAGYTGGHHNKAHHDKQNSVLPVSFSSTKYTPLPRKSDKTRFPLRTCSLGSWPRLGASLPWRDGSILF